MRVELEIKFILVHWVGVRTYVDMRGLEFVSLPSICTIISTVGARVAVEASLTGLAVADKDITGKLRMRIRRAEITAISNVSIGGVGIFTRRACRALMTGGDEATATS